MYVIDHESKGVYSLENPIKFLTSSLESSVCDYFKVEVSLSWDPNCVLSSLVRASNFIITDAKLYVPVVTLSIEDNAKLPKLLREGFKGSVYWNKYKIIPNKT